MIIFTSHATSKLEQRKIKRELVLETLQDFDTIIHTHKNRQAAFKKFGKLYLKVIFIKENDDIIVLTQHWIDKIN